MLLMEVPEHTIGKRCAQLVLIDQKADYNTPWLHSMGVHSAAPVVQFSELASVCTPML